MRCPVCPLAYTPAVIAEDQVSQRIRPVRNPRRPAIPESIARRLPPGQFATPRWPILHQGEIPQFNPETWDFRISGLVEHPTTWNWDVFRALPRTSVDGDLHCVTRWSTLDHHWTGVAPRTIIELVGVSPAARSVLLHGEGGYSANLPLHVFLAEDVILATHHADEPLTPEHGAPLRAVVPSRYAWKSVKWLRGIAFLEDDEPGFWEGYGYSNSADPWREERFES
jgi:DMSO/TMAO reductase YedYZ molybdopterin-dependent catalytic subunit